MNLLLATTLVTGALLAPAAGYAADKTIPQSANDAVIESSVTVKIKSEFAKDKTVSATNIKVDTEEGGVVTLSGNAKSKAEADQAVKIARDISGVISVKNNIVIGDGSKDSDKKSGPESVREDIRDVAITAKIKAGFVKDKTVSAASIKVETDDNGVVTLSGTAKSKAEADQAVKLARNTKGVTSVKNEISIQPK